MEESGTKLHISIVLKHFALFSQKLSVCGRVFISLYRVILRLRFNNYSENRAMEVHRIINNIFKVLLNLLLFMMAGVAIMNVFMSNCTTGEICYQLLIAILCIATIFCKKYRYIGLSIILVLMFIAYLVTK